MPVALEVEELNAGYGSFQVLFDVSFKLGEGEVLAVVGPNGSGKSTLLKALFGLVTLYKGSIRLHGREITGLKPHQIARMGVVYLPQVDNVFTRLTVRENLLMASYRLPRELAEERMEEALEFFPRLKGMLDRRAYTLSGGERQMLALSMAMMIRPKLLMLDEPSTGIAPKLADYIFRKVLELRDTLGVSVILVEQNARKALDVADRAMVLAAGRKVFEGTCQELLETKDILRVYLGLTPR